MYRITKEFHFSASHVLEGLPEGHPCGRLHGHNYVVRVELEAEDLDATGFVLDFGELYVVKQWLDSAVDHRHLNDVWPEMNPTAENIARALHKTIAALLPRRARVAAVRVSETPKTWAEYRV